MTLTTFRDPKWGYDPWVNPNTSPSSVVDTSAKVYQGSDALTGFIVDLPANDSVYMSYVDNFGGWDQLVARFGHTTALLISITIFGGRARCADVEPGAMVPSDIPHWYDNVAIKEDGLLPWIYTSASNWSAVNPFIGNRKVIRWSAHYGHGPHICAPGTCGFDIDGHGGGAQWTQWDDHGANGENLDRSVGPCAAEW